MARLLPAMRWMVLFLAACGFSAGSLCIAQRIQTSETPNGAAWSPAKERRGDPKSVEARPPAGWRAPQTAVAAAPAYPPNSASLAAPAAQVGLPLAPPPLPFGDDVEPMPPLSPPPQAPKKDPVLIIQDPLPLPRPLNSPKGPEPQGNIGGSAGQPGVMGPANPPGTVPLRRPLESTPQPTTTSTMFPSEGQYRTPVDAPLGFTGPSGVLPEEFQDDNHFVPVPDRWRIGFPEWDRYDKGHPLVDDYPYKKGHWWDPFNQNVLKGDYPIIGQHTFLIVTAASKTVIEPRQVPTATTPFESTSRPFSEEFFGRPNQITPLQNFALSLDLFHGDAAFRPMDWRVKVTPIFNANFLGVDELAVINPDVTRGTARARTFLALQEWFVESKLADLSPDYDFVSIRAGSQPFNSDFRGFIFSDINRGVRLFGTALANRDQFNVAFFRQLEKDTNSGLNSFNDRHQSVLVANYFRQDFIWPGYTAQASIHYNHDEPTFKFDNNSVLVRPDPVGVFQPHNLDVVYLGWAGDGHINRFNISHAAYWALGRDSLNPLANQGQDINAQMAACEVSYDRDWMRFRTSFFWSSGDNDISNSHATGFDAIFDNPNFAGGEFSYWQRQAIRLFGVNLTNRESLVPNLRSSKTQGQSNFVNPGLYLANFGVDMDLTPRFRVVNNVNFLWFENTNSLRQFVFQDQVNQYIGADLSTGVEWRPLLSNNIIIKSGLATLLPGRGFRDLFDDITNRTNPLFAAFLEMNFVY